MTFQEPSQNLHGTFLELAAAPKAPTLSPRALGASACECPSVGEHEAVDAVNPELGAVARGRGVDKMVRTIAIAWTLGDSHWGTAIGGQPLGDSHWVQ
jgi:hypothetical protein